MIFRGIAAAVGVAASVVVFANSAQAAEPVPGDVAFVRAVHQVNLAEIAAGQVAWKKTKDPVIKNLSAALMRNHIHLDADLYQMARKLRIFLPDRPTEKQEGLTSRYEAESAATFDGYYVSSQLDMHEETSRLIESGAEKAVDRAVRRFAEDAAPVIADQQELLRDAASSVGIPK